jgi:16S rRNA (cytosine967-C5)-methyltransferase
MPQESARSLAVAALGEWRRGQRFADSILQESLSRTPLDASDRAFATELFYGVLRNLALLDFWISMLRGAPIDHDSRDLIRLGLYQLLLLRTPTHAAVYETVELASRRNRPLVNALLRSAGRRTSELQEAAQAASLAIRTSHPELLVERWTQGFGVSAATDLCEWNNQPAPIYARVNTLKISPAEFKTRNPAAAPVPNHPLFVQLSGIPSEALASGECYIQDPSTATAVQLLEPRPGQRVLDACAAPGGKSAFIAALMENHGELISCDRDPARVATLTGNLARAGVTIARPKQQDWTRAAPDNDTAAQSFDRILLDAPCTNTGVLRRRVDARWRLRSNDFTRMPGEQLSILRALVPLLKPGGALVYSTCSIEAEENQQVVSRALAEFPFLRLDGQTSVLPFRDRFDGAFAARLLREG